jgi:hypothetical protein
MTTSTSDDKRPELEAQQEAVPPASRSDSKRDDEITQTEPIEMGVLSDIKNTPPIQNQTEFVEAAEEPPKRMHLSGWRLYILTFGLCLSLLLSTLETTIVSTSLVSITNALSGFENRDWVVTSYLLTYTGTFPSPLYPFQLAKLKSTKEIEGEADEDLV